MANYAIKGDLRGNIRFIRTVIRRVGPLSWLLGPYQSMIYFHSKKKLKAERDRLRAEIKVVASKNTERMIAACSSGKPLSIDEILQPLNPLTLKVVEIENQIIEQSSKSELVAERSALQSELDFLLQGSKSLFELSELQRLDVRDINRKISKLDYVIDSKYGFVNSIGRWFENTRTILILAAGVAAIGSLIFRLFQ